MEREETVFDKIIRREIPANIVYEDEYVLAFLSIEPVHKGHTLVIPKRHCENIFDCPPEDGARVFAVSQKIARHMRDVLGADGVNIHMNNGAAADQEVFHLHQHVIPRYADKHPFQKPTHEAYEDGEAAEYAKRLQIT